MDRGRRVVFNTFIMYIQLILNVLIGFVSVRLLLNALGQIYDVIGGVVGLLSFISNSLSQSSMRFISVSLGKNDLKDTSMVFNSCFWLHLFIAFGLCIILELVGLFLFDGFLNIPDDRVSTGKVIYQCMVLSLFIKINSSPLSALICSYEDFWYKALVSITESILKLLIAIIIVKTTRDKLFIYGLLMVCVTVVNYLMYFIYSRCKFTRVVSIAWPEKDGIKAVMGFAGWTLMDTFSSVINRQGYSVMLNKFFGPVMNSAFAVSRQLEGHIYTISAAVVNSMKPQIMKSHGEGDDTRMFRLSMTAGKFGFFMMSLVTIPLLVMMPDFLKLWLNNVPEHAISFSRLLIIACLVEQLTRGLVHANQAYGNIKWFSIIVSSMRVLALPVSCFALLFGSSAETAILIFVFFETLGSISRAIILSRISSFEAKFFFKSIFIQVLPPFIISYAFCYFLSSIKDGLFWICFVVFASVLIMALCILLIGLTSEEKSFIKAFLKRR